MWRPPIPLADLLERACAGNAPPGWLYLPRDWKTWTADTPAYVIDGDDDEADPDRVEAEAKGRGYACAVDDQILEDVVRGAERLKARSFAARLEALIYYQRFDAFLPQIGAPDPPPWEETRLRMDREFYDRLGSERPDVPCREAGCGRGAVRLSVFCKVHHFQQVQRRPCPFTD